MRHSLFRWLELYGESHQNRANQIIHKICVPLIFWAVVALLWAIPLGPIRIALPVAFLALVFYFRLSLKAGFFMLAQIFVMIVAAAYLEAVTGQLVPIAIIIFVLAWIGQFVGHHIEGKKPSFFEDLQFLLIGPLWVFRWVF